MTKSTQTSGPARAAGSTRAASAAATREALLDATERLLDEAGLQAVTLRGVGAAAGVSRSAPYRHFTDKDQLLSAVATRAWERLAATVNHTSALTPRQRLEQAMAAYVLLARTRPSLYRLMFRMPENGSPELADAATAAQTGLIELVAAASGEHQARQRAAVLLAGAHGIADLALSGHLTMEKWQTSPGDLVDLLVAAMTRDPSPAHADSGKAAE